MYESLLKKECNLQFFHDNHYIRKKCKSCGAFFWTLNPNSKKCGDQPCVNLDIITNPISDETLSLKEVRNRFVSFFEKKKSFYVKLSRNW